MHHASDLASRFTCFGACYVSRHCNSLADHLAGVAKFTDIDIWLEDFSDCIIFWGPSYWINSDFTLKKKGFSLSVRQEKEMDKQNRWKHTILINTISSQIQPRYGHFRLQDKPAIEQIGKLTKLDHNFEPIRYLSNLNHVSPSASNISCLFNGWWANKSIISPFFTMWPCFNISYKRSTLPNYYKAKSCTN